MARKTISIALCGAFFLLILISIAPARLLGHMVPASQIYLQGFSGTIWQGRTSNAAIALAGGWFQLGEVEWSLSPWSLLWLSPRLSIESHWGAQRLETDLSIYPGGAITLHEINSNFSAGLVQQFLPLQLRGQLNLLATDLELVDGLPAAGQGRLVWQQGYWIGTSSSQALGDYVLEFSLLGPLQASAEISTLSGPVAAQGKLNLEGRNYSVDMNLSSESGFASEIASALQLMAAPVEGGYRLQFSSGI